MSTEARRKIKDIATLIQIVLCPVCIAVAKSPTSKLIWAVVGMLIGMRLFLERERK